MERVELLMMVHRTAEFFLEELVGMGMTAELTSMVASETTCLHLEDLRYL